MPTEPLPPDPRLLDQLREMVARLVTDLDEGGQYQAAAYVSMAAAILVGVDGPPSMDALVLSVDLEFEADEHGRVWMIREGDCHIIGPTDAVRAEMCRFLAASVRPEPQCCQPKDS